jgi:hypothetical protein
MDIFVDTQITDILEPFCKKFYSACLDEDEDYYNHYITMDQNEKFNNFICTIIGDKVCFKKYYDILLINGCDKKEVNSFFYNYLKMKQKSEKKIWSWSEMEHFNIDPDMKDWEIETTSKYKFF